jgi:hypothetical protein
MQQLKRTPTRQRVDHDKNIIKYFEKITEGTTYRHSGGKAVRVHDEIGNLAQNVLGQIEFAYTVRKGDILCHFR